MIGGFLGAGKSTAVLQLARWLERMRGVKAAIITNDQANGLVDTALVNGGAFAVHEIGGGCFCCRSESLVEALNQFSERLRPDVVIGEPVGSCTDLVSTVLAPLRTIYRSDYVLAPLSVIVDPFRGGRLLTGSGGSGNAGFSKDVEYIFLKQLEEAEIIVVNKCDLYPKGRLDELCEEAKKRYPHAEVLRVSARTGEGLEEWWDLLMTRTHSVERLMDVDYEVYAGGEARLGWVNGEYEVRLARVLRKEAIGVAAINGNRLLEMVAGSIAESFRAAGIEVAHLKISLQGAGGGNGRLNIQHSTLNIEHPKEGSGHASGVRTGNVQRSTSNAEHSTEEGPPGSDDRALAAIQWVRNDIEPEMTRRMSDSIQEGRLLLNLRAEAEPVLLTGIVKRALNTLRGQAELEEKYYAAFKPSPPKPTHRVTELDRSVL